MREGTWSIYLPYPRQVSLLPHCVQYMVRRFLGMYVLNGNKTRMLKPPKRMVSNDSRQPNKILLNPFFSSSHIKVYRRN